jgi:hypothetical protein
MELDAIFSWIQPTYFPHLDFDADQIQNSVPDKKELLLQARRNPKSLQADILSLKLEAQLS